MARPVVTPEAFAQLACNRCGDCCEGFSLPKLWKLGSYLSSIPGTKPSVLSGQPPFYAPPTIDDLRTALWLTMVEPSGEHYPNGDPKYRCLWFERDESGLGVCTNYEERPRVCSEYPYGRRARESERCPFNVDIDHGPPGEPKTAEKLIADMAPVLAAAGLTLESVGEGEAPC